MTMLQQYIHYLANKPFILDLLRRILEANHRGEKRVIREEFAGQEGIMLDLGCGTGVFSPLFGSGYVGIDISPLYIAYARKKHDKTFQVMSADRLLFPDVHFDSIFVNGVLHHLDDATVRTVVAEMRRVLKPSGQAVVMEDIPAVTFVSKIIRGLDIGDHIRPAESYRRLLAERFTILREYPMRTGVCDYAVFVLN